MYDKKAKMPLKFQQINILLEVAVQGSISKAARALYLTQPAISKAIQEMEQDLGVSLISRTPQGVTLTSFGEVLVRRGRTIHQEMEMIRDELDTLRGNNTYHLRIAVANSAAFGPFHKTLIEFQHDFPDVRLEITEMRSHPALEALINNDMDIAIVARSAETPDLHYYWEELYALLNTVTVRRGHPLQHARSLTELREETWLDSDPNPNDSMLGLIFRRYNLPLPKRIVYSPCFTTFSRLSAETNMVAVWSQHVQQFPDSAKKYHYLDLEEVLPPRTIGFACRDLQRLSEPAWEFLKRLRLECRYWMAQKQNQSLLAKRN